MTTRVIMEPVFVLHHRPYQNSSLIVEFLSQQHGRVTAIARSARGPKSRFRGYLQMFSPLLASWSGRRELMNLNQLELRGAPLQLPGCELMCAFYLNELVLRLVPRHDPSPEIFAVYQRALQQLEQSTHTAAILRCFEKRLLEHLGYGLSLQVNPDGYYQWRPDGGFFPCHSAATGGSSFSGRTLLALQAEQWENPDDLAAAKRLLRMVLESHLGGKPVKSRELLR